MAFCSKCGKQLEEGEKFCGVCGTPVGAQPQSEGQAKTQQVPDFAAAQPAPVNSNLNIYFSQILDVAKNMLTKPAETIEAVDEKLSKEASFILGGVLAVIYSILGMWEASALVSKLTSTVNTVSKLNPLGELTGNLTGSLTSSIAELKQYIPYSKLFLFSIVIFVVFVGVLFASIVLIAKYVLKSQSSVLAVWKIVISASIPYVAVVLVQVLATYLNLKLAAAIGLIGIIVSAFTLYRGINKELKVDENKILFMMPIAYLITLFLTSLIMNTMIKNYIVSIFSRNIF